VPQQRLNVPQIRPPFQQQMGGKTAAQAVLGDTACNTPAGETWPFAIESNSMFLAFGVANDDAIFL